MTSRRTAIVLSGGGARGAYEAGVLSYLFEHVYPELPPGFELRGLALFPCASTPRKSSTGGAAHASSSASSSARRTVRAAPVAVAMVPGGEMLQLLVELRPHRRRRYWTCVTADGSSPLHGLVVAEEVTGRTTSGKLSIELENPLVAP